MGKLPLKERKYDSNRSAEKTFLEIKRKSLRKYLAEEKIGIILEGLDGEGCIDVPR